MRLGVALALVLVLVATTPARAAEMCAPRVSSAYERALARTLASGRDLRGEALLRRPGGPSYASAVRGMPPLLLARTSGRRPLTRSGVYYVPSARPGGAQGAGSPMLLLADGSEVRYGSVAGPRLAVSVGAGERFGSCLRRLRPARLAAGYLPVLQTAYVARTGERYVQESFATSLPDGAAAAYARFSFAGGRVRVATQGGAYSAATSFAVRWVPRHATPLEPVDDVSYAAARASYAAYWSRRLDEGAAIVVPEQRVQDAVRATLVQNLIQTWRYSIGNPYEEFSFPESLDGAQVLAEYGFADVARAILRTSFTRRPGPYPNWKMGEKLLGAATVYGLDRDRAFLSGAEPFLRSYVAALARRIGADGLLARERYSSDIPDSVRGLHSQAVAWQGLRAVAAVLGARSEGRRAAAAAARLRRGIRAALARSTRPLRDGSLFVPMRLLDGERAYPLLPASRDGSYWNLVAPYALASGILTPAEEAAALRYLLGHGSRFLGLVRAGAFALYGPGTSASGIDQVYGVNMARLLARLDEPDQLVLGLYGQLAAAMTPGTYIGGEAASLTPIAGAYYRSMYLPPNSISNAAFLETVRSALVQERADGLRLAYATPRGWLAPGKQIGVERMPTRLGPVSYSLTATARAVRAVVEAPGIGRRRLLLRLRLPARARITSVTVGATRISTWSARSSTIDLTERGGKVELEARLAR